jgi:hypothetical protein
MAIRSGLHFFLISLFVTGLAHAEESGLADTAEMIRDGEIEVGSVYSVDLKKGRFHKIHTDKILLDCGNCHTGAVYKEDYLLINKEKALTSRQINKTDGRVEKSVCLGCHLKGGVATTFYKHNSTH